MPMGRLMKKIQRQPIVETNTAPSVGPASAATAQTELNAPCIRARCSIVNRSPTIVSATGRMQPAPTPCRARKATSQAMLGAQPQSSDVAVNQARPARSTRRRPWMSASRPHSGTVVVLVRR